VLHDVTGGEGAPMKMSHVVLNVPPNAKYQIANRIAARDGRTIVFVRTKLAADRIAEDMRASGVLAVALHGDKSQAERNNAITGFRAGTIPVLVATDVAARGIHVDAVDLVLQLDPPADHKDYTHRSGRTARAGETGVVVTLVLPHQRRQTDRLFESAGVEPNFRKIRSDDAESLAMVDALTGGREPSGIRVPEPQLPRAARGRPERGGRGAGRERPHRPARRDDVRREPRRDAASAPQRDEVARRERELAERERALARRERELSSREQQVSTASTRPERPAYVRPSRDERPAYQRPDRPTRDDGPARTGGKPWEERTRDDRPARGERPARTGDTKPRTGGKPWVERKRDDEGRPSGARASGPRSEGKQKKSDGGKKGKTGSKSGPAASSRRGQPRPKKKR
jgi:superfamily II DNA/RNA helicase